MFKLLVADDEAAIRRGIVAMLGRALTSEDIAFIEASNGEQALELCHTEAPDLIISDIRMPGCDGLDFIRRLRMNANSPDVIIISGYEDFSYAKTAISLGVKEYVLKPVKKQEFVAMVSGYMQRIKESRHRKGQEVDHHISVHRAEEALRRSLMLELLDASDAVHARHSLEQLKDLNIYMNNGLLLSVALQIRLTGDNEDYITIAVRNIAGEALQELGLTDVKIVDCGSGILAFLYHGQKGDSLLADVKNSLNRILILLKQYLKAEVFAGVGEPVFGGEALSKSFQTAKQALLCKVFGQGGSLQYFERLPDGGNAPRPDFDKLFPNADAFTESKVIALFDNILFSKPSRSSMSALQSTHRSLERYVNKKLAAFNYAANPIRQIYRLEMMWDPQQLRRETAAYVKWAAEYLREQPGGSGSILLSEIIRYVRSNAANEINLNLVARQFSRSPSYLSTLFKRETGLSFTELLTTERMKLAREILEDTHIPVAEVSILCGYVNPKHFSSVFKKAFGESPAAFRENHWLERQISR